MKPKHELKQAFGTAWAEGFCLIRDCVTESERCALLIEVRAMKLWPLPNRVGTVRQRADMAISSAPDWGPTTADIAYKLSDSASASASASKLDCPEFEPNEAMLQRYGDRASHVGPHVDSRRYQNFIVVLSLKGRAVFTVYGLNDADHTSNVLRPGDVVILRGSVPGQRLASLRHEVGPPMDGVRTSLTFRQRDGE